ncbi:helix-turn-helix domain-containing protein [Bacteroides caecimuris]|uniref:helix-turn-helix domain-containing protein n=1 Tax=Bacteroides caecimuris TaxID=1796613 RepID=UPI00256FF021|nr:helix-turn-helix transcriptional regulator [Bacteroides caecimuris]
MESINVRFKDLRKACNKTQEDMGHILGLSRSGISEIESGRRSVTEQHLIMLKNWDEKPINIEWLRTGQGEMFKQLTNQEELMKYTALLLKDNKSAIASAIQALIVTYEQLDDSNKDVLEKVALQYIENLKKSR